MTTSRIPRILTVLLAGTLALGMGTGPLAAQDDDAVDAGYGFYRIVEGEALLTGSEDDAKPLEVEYNYPVLTGDRLWVAERSRLEAILPDKSILRLDAETEVFFESLADSADSPEGAATTIRLFEGELQLTGDEYVMSRDPVQIDTPNSRTYLHLPGNYRLIHDVRGWTEVVVREGFAEVSTDRGSTVARDGESVEITGDQRPEVSLTTAGGLDDLEIWGAELSGELLASDTYLDESLAYAAAPLERSGYWVDYSGRRAWRPSVRVGWRPFTDGWWAYTPSGLSWVAYEPWGWVTSHYGAWDYAPGYGWLWFPGTVYSPAWVYWYWGPTHAAWVPSGYYSRYYGSRFGFGFRFGVYGWAGGYWDSWGHWTFCPTRYFGRRGYRSYWRSGHEMHRDRRLHAVPRGVVTTDTRDVTPRRWGKPTEIVQALERRHSRGAGVTRGLGDVTPFVERRSTLPEQTKRMISGKSSPGAIAVSRGARDRGSGDSRHDVATAPWKVDKPETTRSGRDRSRPTGTTVRGAGATATDWELVERLRRFENKQETAPRSPRSITKSESSQELRRVTPRTETPTRRILEGVRHRSPQGVDERRAPATSRERPAKLSQPERRPPTASGDRSISRSPAQRRAPTASSSRSSGAKRSTMRSTPRSSGSRSSGRATKPSSGSSSKKSGTTSRSSARKRGG